MSLANRHRTDGSIAESPRSNVRGDLTAMEFSREHRGTASKIQKYAKLMYAAALPGRADRLRSQIIGRGGDDRRDPTAPRRFRKKKAIEPADSPDSKGRD